ncbi:glutathione s-transferase [Diplodia corticola]|uniref:Glutathione s-transferase n=1 Tax=Diplodia corticola TaxID=236234 RepID=A0A1J9RNP5_9PEZI|nr:glutathione s-transferase [Diplodia corticola]OJD29548.1 glutathione s-transferase [Diplodia corticola]
MSSPVILYDYDFSPFSQKMRYLLHLSGVEFQRVDQPVVLPRPDLQVLGITYRRIPVLAMGKDVFCDTSAMVDVVQRRFQKVRAGRADKAFEAFAARFFENVIPAVPAKFSNPSFRRDRETIFPVLGRPDLESLRPSAVGGVVSMLGVIENEFLGGGGQYLGGDEPSMADVYVAPLVRWALQTIGLGDEAGMTKEDFPRVHSWVSRLPVVQPEAISALEAEVLILEAEYSEEKADVPQADPLGIAAGEEVSVESADAAPGCHPQVGRLAGLTRDETVVELENGIRLHFPRAGYIVRRRE